MKTLMAVLGLTATHALGAKIKHVVLLMEENRSFDHMCGFFPGVNGLKGNESNPYDTRDPTGRRVTVTKDSPYISPFSPDHSFSRTTEKIFGLAAMDKGDYSTANMDGFVETEIQQNNRTDPEVVMRMFTPERLPVMSALAENFAIFDRFFCSLPGPTWPNRLFQLMGTSKGDLSTKQFHPYTGLYFGKTVFDLVEEVGLDWKFYYADAPLEMAFIEKITRSPERVHDWYRFKKDIREGDLPTFSWVNPRWFVNETSGEGANDQHPDHDVRLGEALLKEVYEELRAGPAWNETLFIVTYDEHGGYYDHVPTPLTGVPDPDHSESFPDKGFNFTRLGVRIPALMISPWTQKGQVISEPAPEDKPFPTSEFELTSVIATVGKLFNNTKHLTKRDAWAATFDNYLSEPSPRTDCPRTLPDAPKSLGAEHAAAEGARPINELQKEIVEAFASLRGLSELTKDENMPKLQSEAGKWIHTLTQEILEGNHVYRKSGLF
eukprot:TRINITY_DN1770_c2_g1_i2.p1 TRINITY_DN1770_c2_g1~~TRINITY_DN1770_c2_g1_i2.p1  ORF type:complete len:492 (+),score=82.80 TRINITY_DN1770_c2_g1_i2:66-1541(+)